MTFFSPQSTFRLAGSIFAGDFAGTCASMETIRAQVAALIRVWDWQAIEFRNFIFDGDTAAVRYYLTTIFKPSGETITTEIVDVMTVRGRHVIEFHQFVDTAAVEKIAARHCASM